MSVRQPLIMMGSEIWRKGSRKADRMYKLSKGYTNTGFQKLLAAGSVAAFAAALIFRRNLDAEYSLLCTMGMISCPVSIPDSAAAWFLLYQEIPLAGLLYLSFFDLINFLLVGLFFLAVSGLFLREGRKNGALAGAALTTAGVLLYLFTNPALSFLYLSDKYLAAPDEMQRLLLSFGQQLLQRHEINSFSGAGYYPSFLLFTIAGLILACLMWKSRTFDRVSAVIGFLANFIGLSYYLFLIIRPALVYLPLSISAVFLLAWYLMVGRRLWILSAKGADYDSKTTSLLIDKNF